MIVVVLLFGIIIVNYLRPKLYDLSSMKPTFQIGGSVTEMYNETMIIVDPILYIGKDRGTVDEIQTKYIEIELYLGENELVKINKLVDEETAIGELLSRMSVRHSIKGKINNRQLRLQIYYLDSNNEPELFGTAIINKEKC